MTSILLIILIVACVTMELNPKTDTDNLFEKIGVGMIVLGSILQLANVYTDLIVSGSAIYFATVCYRDCKAKHDRRENDGVKKRKILS